MKKQPFFPRTNAERAGWYLNIFTQLPLANATLEQDPIEVAKRVNDAKNMYYTCGPWLEWTRELGPAGTAALEVAATGTGSTPKTLPVFTPPEPPDGMTPVPPGAQTRILDFMQVIKRSGKCTDDLAALLRIVGADDTVEHELPEFTLKIERGGGCECVKVTFRKFEHEAVVVWSRRGGGAWENLAVAINSPYLDERPLLVPGQPEQREYRLQPYGDHGPVGGFTDVVTVTVSP